MSFDADALYNALIRDIGDGPKELQPMSSRIENAKALIRKNFLRKEECSDPRAENAALLKFLEANLRCENWTLQLESERDQLLYGYFVTEVRRFLTSKFEERWLIEDYAEIEEGARQGPGVALGANGKDFYTKMFSSPLACTSPAIYDHYLRFTRRTTWLGAEIRRRHEYGRCRLVEGNKLSFVPKYRDIARVICTEPSLNMFYQLGIGHVLTCRLKSRFGINLETQPFKNRTLARIGSITDKWFTIDLEAASDSISLEMCRAVLPSWFFNLLCEFRSPFCNTPIGKRGLEMMSSMGNGFTFPLQTMLFSCVVAAAAKVAEIKLDNPNGDSIGNWGVFGDDIIAPSELYVDVKRLLSILGFSVNVAKSFAEGPFRESCGYDAFLGQNIRSVYIKKYKTKQERYAIINRLNMWSATTGISIPETIAMLVKSVPWNPVPRYEDESAGIQIPFSLLVRRPRFCSDTGSILYFPYVATDRKISIGERVLKVPRGEKPRIYNGPGLLISFIGGTVNGVAKLDADGRKAKGYIPIPQKEDGTQYRRARRVAPFWDFSPTRVWLHPGKPWSRWETTVHENMRLVTSVV